MNPIKPEPTTVLKQLEIFLEKVYCEKNDNPIYQFDRDAKGNKIFTRTDPNNLFFFESITTGIEHESEFDRIYFIIKGAEEKLDQHIAVWSLTSYAAIKPKDEKQKELIYNFRRTAYHTRMYDQDILPIRGPKLLNIGLLKYETIKAVTDWKKFSSTDIITLNNTNEVYRGNYQGGLLLSEESLEALIPSLSDQKLQPDVASTTVTATKTEEVVAAHQ